MYEPDEDSYLLIDALNMETSFLAEQLKPKSVLEVGVGSGAVINSLWLMLRRKNFKELSSCLFKGTDINPAAIECASKVRDLNKTTVDFILTERSDGYLENLDGKVDVLIFNPPYVETSEEELLEAQSKRGIEASCSGGKEGIQLLTEMLPSFEKMLSSAGVMYLLLISDNLRVINLLEQMGFRWTVVMKREVLGEN